MRPDPERKPMKPILEVGRNFFGGWFAAAIDPSFFRKCREEQLWPHQVEWARYAYQLNDLRNKWVARAEAVVEEVLRKEEIRLYGSIMSADDPNRRTFTASLPRRRFLLDTPANDYLFIMIKDFGEGAFTVQRAPHLSEETFDELSLYELRGILIAVRWRPW